MRAQRVEHAEVLTSQVHALRSAIEAFDDKNTPVPGKASIRNRNPCAAHRLRAGVPVVGELGILSWIEGLHDARGAPFRDARESSFWSAQQHLRLHSGDSGIDRV